MQQIPPSGAATRRFQPARRRALGVLAGAAASAAVATIGTFGAGTAWAQSKAADSFPTRPIQLVLPWMFFSSALRHLAFAAWPELRPAPRSEVPS